jgi:hypothetical protein
MVPGSFDRYVFIYIAHSQVSLDLFRQSEYLHAHPYTGR